ncbi:MAG: hypothetical protein M1453_14840 [Acidobacteria bacterium]|nr:hypothetical protein [Acidobacteriota bacterium]MCL5289257.1 hypothetical protein [Acidobacteriota bacterium]
MRYLYVTGGKQKPRLLKSEEEWNLYERALILRLDTQAKSSEVCVDYVSPPEAQPDDFSSVLFKAGTLGGKRLWVTTSTEVMIYDVPNFQPAGRVSLPCFHDVHHVMPTPEGNLLIANTGLDMVVEVAPDGNTLREWDVLGEPLWTRFSREVDYRKVFSTKPHKSHPNFVFFLEGEPWVTRFKQKDAICLTQPARRIAIDVEKPHDGAQFGERIYFTTVDGRVVIVNKCSLQVEQVVDLNKIDGGEGQVLGWCRGIHVVDERRVWVGFTRIRHTKFKENVLWVKHAFRDVDRPTHITLYDLAEKEALNEINLEEFSVNIIFGIFPAD